MFQVGVELLTGAPYHITTPVMAMVFVLYGIMCCVLSPQVQVRVTKISIVVLGLSMAAVVIAAGVYVLSDMIKSEWRFESYSRLTFSSSHTSRLQ